MQRPRVGPLGPVGASPDDDGLRIVTDGAHEAVALEVSPHRKRRRPSGEAPALPRPLQSTGKYWLSLIGGVVGVWVALAAIPGAGEQISQFDTAIVHRVATIRNDILTAIARTIDAAGAYGTTRAMRWGLLIALLAFKRFRHLFVWLGAVLGVGWVTTTVATVFFRARPGGVEILGHWEGSSHPSRPIALLAVTLLGVCYTMIPPGRGRTIGKWVSTGILALLGLARLYLGVEHPSDFITGVTLGVGIPLVAFRLLTPNEIFPVHYGRGRAAHLDVGGARGDALRAALEEQLGITVTEIKPFNLAGSGGSTPVRLTVQGDYERWYLFAKLYAHTHLRADRWYKLGRTLLYGRLEDEASFNTVRRLVQYEDYMQRFMRDAGLNVPEPYGFVEITPEREYLMVTSFLDDAKEIHDVEMTEQIMDEALLVVRKMWDAGIAHRDVKPSNILVRNGHIHMIDVAFGQIRPSPWRQAVDLANMMLVLALRSDAKTVYEHALKYFTPDDIAEAFAATQGVTIPSQSRNMLRKEKKRSLIKEFRALAPARPPISIQRWSFRRVGLTLTVLGAAFLSVVVALSNLEGAGLL
jgi:tRNA A-37 threonylcarbamoyl transferase component Bud32/membrane-associated phospholipid phosphatase